jgi:hypothetical protein
MMLRDLATILIELHSGLQATAERAGVRVTHAEMTLPVDTALALKDGGCVLQADVARSYADADWREQPCRLTLVWNETPTEMLI